MDFARNPLDGIQDDQPVIQRADRVRVCRLTTMDDCISDRPKFLVCGADTRRELETVDRLCEGPVPPVLRILGRREDLASLPLDLGRQRDERQSGEVAASFRTRLATSCASAASSASTAVGGKLLLAASARSPSSDSSRSNSNSIGPALPRLTWRRSDFSSDRKSSNAARARAGHARSASAWMRSTVSCTNVARGATGTDMATSCTRCRRTRSAPTSGSDAVRAFRAPERALSDAAPCSVGEGIWQRTA